MVMLFMFVLSYKMYIIYHCVNFYFRRFFLKVKTNWAYDQYRIMQRIVCWFVFGVSSDAHILSCAKASFLQPLLCQPWRSLCSLSAVLSTLCRTFLLAITPHSMRNCSFENHP